MCGVSKFNDGINQCNIVKHDMYNVHIPYTHTQSDTQTNTPSRYKDEHTIDYRCNDKVSLSVIASSWHSGKGRAHQHHSEAQWLPSLFPMTLNEQLVANTLTTIVL